MKSSKIPAALIHLIMAEVHHWGRSVFHVRFVPAGDDGVVSRLVGLGSQLDSLTVLQGG